MSKYWMLKVENGGSPHTIYIDYNCALRRAMDLARGTKCRVGILELTQWVEPILPKEEEIQCVVKAVQ